MSSESTHNGMAKLGEDSDGNELVAFWPDDSTPGPDRKALTGATDSADADTPTVTGTQGVGQVGVLKRHLSDRFTAFQHVDPKEFALNSAELSTTIKTFRDEMYRTEFPVLIPGFEYRCDECGAEYEDDVGECEICGGTAFSEPSTRQKRRARRFFKSVNKEGQSLRGLMEYEEDYQSYRGVSVIVARRSYEKRKKGTRIGDRVYGTTYEAVPDTDAGPNGVLEFVHADSRTMLPITDEDNRLGGAWICPFHRSEYWTDDEITPGEATCPDCQTRLEEAGYAEIDGINSDEIENLYLIDEVISWARHFPEHNGLDGRSPVLPMLKLQAIVQFIRDYEISTFNGENTERLPNKFFVAMGPNISSNLKTSVKEESDKSAWESGQVYFDGAADDIEIDVIDLTPGGVIDGREGVIERQQSQIRAAFGVSDALENDLSDAGGLNAEGTQIEITNRAIASAHQDTEDKALNAIEDVVGLTDWELKFVDPKREENELGPQEAAQAISALQQAGVKWEVSDEQVLIPDQSSDDADAPVSDGAPEQEDADQMLLSSDARRNPALVAEYARRYTPREAEDACECLERIAEECLWDEISDADPVDHKTNLPAIRNDGDVPEFAQELIGDAIEAGAIEKPQDISNYEFLQMQDAVRDSLLQPQGWSIDSVDRKFQSIMPDIDPSVRRNYAINAVQNVVNEARLLGYAVTDPPLDERWFYFAGPRNANICASCDLLLEETNPSHGGTPMRWNELIDRIGEIAAENFPGLEPHGAQIHPACAHTTAEYREGRGNPRSDLP